MFGKRNEFRTDGAALEEYDTELNEHRKIESEWLNNRYNGTTCLYSNSFYSVIEKEIMKHLSKLRHQVVKFKKLLKDIKSSTKCK